MRTAPIGLTLVVFAVFAGCAVVERPLGPEVTMSFNSERVAGETAVVDGDTIVFRPIAPGHAPESLPPITAEAVQGGIAVNGYFPRPFWASRSRPT
jgi:hypothetical protein